MGIIIRQSIKSTLAMYIGGFLGLLNRIYLMPKFLSLDQIGMLDLLLIAGMLFANIASLGTIGSLVKFYHIFERQGRLKYFLGFLVKWGLFGVLIVCYSLYLFKPGLVQYYSQDSALVGEYFPFFYVFLIAFLLKGLLANYSLTNKRATVPSMLFDFGLKAIQLVLLLLLGFHLLDFSGLVLVFSSSFYLLLFILFLYNKKQFGLSLNFRKNLLPTERKSVRNYSFFVWFAALSGTITQFLDTAMLGSYEGLAVAGIYSIAFNLGQSIEMPRRAISSISLPILVKKIDEEKHDEVDKIYKQSSINQGIIGGLLLLLIIVCLDSFFYLLPQSKSLAIGKNVALIIGSARFFDMITGVNSEILRSSNKYRYDFYIILSFIVISILLNAWLIPLFQINGAALASLLAIFGFNSVRIIVLKVTYGYFPFTSQTIKLVLLLVALVAIRFLFPTNPWQSQLGALSYMAILTLIFGSVYVFISKKMNLSVEWNSLLDNILSRISKR